MAVALGLLAGCTANPKVEPAVAVEPASVAVASAVVEPAVVAEAASAAVEPAVVGEPAAAVVEPAVPPIAAPAELESTSPAGPVVDLEPLQRALGGGFSEAVEIVATHAIGREQLVLARVYDARIWAGRETAAGRIAELREQYEAAADRCEDENSALDVRCTLAFAGELHLAWELLGVQVFAWEVARLRPGPDGYTVVARRRLSDASMAIGDDYDEPPKFKVYDVDNDRRAEAMVVVPIKIPMGDGLERLIGQIGVIVDASDLHEQFLTSRHYNYVFEDVTRSETDAETTWFARDLDADGHADLQVREVVRESYSGGEGEETQSGKKLNRRTTTCPYDPASDTWRCAEALGRQLFEPR